jgi:type I restriction enzyme, S subunit
MKLRDVCTLINGRAYRKPELLKEGMYPVLRVGNFFTNNHWYYSDLQLSPEKYCESGDLLYAWSASFGPRIWSGQKVIFHYHIWKVQTGPLIDKRFLFMWFLWDVERIKRDHGTGSTMIHVAKGSMEDRDIRLPPLPEQRRIVGILEDALDSVVIARSAAETSQKKSGTLLKSYVESVFAQRGIGWAKMPIGACFRVRSGDFLPAKSMVGTGKVDVYGGNGIAGKHDKKNRTGSNVIIGRVGAKCGNVRFVGGDIWVTDNAFYVSEYLRQFDARFLATLLNLKQLRGTANQTAQPVISYTTIKDVVLAFPSSVAEQERLGKNFQAIEAEAQRLGSIYRRKVGVLEELRKSLLHQAFAGHL